MIKEDADGTKKYYVYGLGLISEETNNVMSYYHYDYRGSTIALTDSNETITDQYTYGPYGETLTHIGISDISFQYVGKFGVVTDNNGLLFMMSRYYNTDIRRFISQDTVLGSISKSLSTNQFIYTADNPVNYIDQNGEFPTWLVTVTIGAVIGGVIGGGGNIISQGLSKGWNNINYKEVAVNTVSGIASGALAGTGATLIAAVGGNAVIGGLNYAGSQLVNNKEIKLKEVLISSALSGAAGAIGGSGMLTGTSGRELLDAHAAYAANRAMNSISGQEFQKQIIKAGLENAAVTNIIRTSFGALVSNSGGYYFFNDNGSDDILELVNPEHSEKCDIIISEHRYTDR